MLNPIKKLALLVLASVLAVPAQAFSLLGPFDTWQVQNFDYIPSTVTGTFATFYGGVDTGGPQQIGQQYRWNTPRIYYAYDGTFVTYFGAAGIKAVEQAIAVYNALPAVSLMSSNLTEFPLDSRGINLTAQALGILDLKSVAMAEIAQEIGLANADRYVWTLHARTLPTGLSCPNYTFVTVMRNFDPITWNPSAYVNNVLYSYITESQCPPAPDLSDALEQLVDPTAIGASAISDESSALSLSGTYYTGLTRDDAGGLRNILSRHQVAPLSIPFNATNGTSAGGLPAFVGTTQNGSPWNLAVAISLTNATVLGNNGSPWTIISFNNGTNTTNTITVPTTGTTVSNATIFNTAGLEKLTFIQVPYDSTIGINYTAFFDSYVLPTYLNGRATSTPVVRAITSPDFIFASGDLNTGTAYTAPNILARTGDQGTTPPHYLNSTGRKDVNGPGIIQGSLVTFSSIGPFVLSGGLVGNISNGTVGTGSVINWWGSFDGSTNAPIVYPDGLSIQQIEGQLFP